MKYISGSDASFLITEIDPADLNGLSIYLSGLSESTRKWFGPHDFQWNGLTDFYTDKRNTGYTLVDLAGDGVIAYAVVRQGYVYGDFDRYQRYGIDPDQDYDCSFAPSVADTWQSKGIGNMLLQHILKEVKRKQFRRMVLWGGVQEDNDRAVRFYLKNQFRMAGNFFHNGNNRDMIKIL